MNILKSKLLNYHKLVGNESQKLAKECKYNYDDYSSKRHHIYTKKEVKNALKDFVSEKRQLESLGYKFLFPSSSYKHED